MTKHTTREGWLVDAMAALDKEFFSGNGYALPERMKVSCGFPRGIAKAIGQCYDPKCSADDTTHMFVCPTLDNQIEVLAVLLHEMVHACVGLECGHKGAFRKMAKELGFAGKMTATVAQEGGELWLKLSQISTSLGAYPHAGLRKITKATKRAGWVRLVSPEDEKYKVVISPRVLEASGPTTDPWGNEMVPAE